MAIEVALSLFSPKISQPKLSIHNFYNLPSNGRLKLNSEFNNPLPKIFLTTRKTHQTLKFQPHKNQINCLFTGIVEEMGKVKHLGYAENGGFDLKIGAKTVLEDVKLGDSIAVNGTCLTVTEFNTELSEFTVGLAPETLRKTSLIELEPGSAVNLERALQPSTRMGGHFVQVSSFTFFSLRLFWLIVL